MVHSVQFYRKPEHRDTGTHYLKILLHVRKSTSIENVNVCTVMYSKLKIKEKFVSRQGRIHEVVHELSLPNLKKSIIIKKF